MLLSGIVGKARRCWKINPPLNFFYLTCANDKKTTQRSPPAPPVFVSHRFAFLRARQNYISEGGFVEHVIDDGGGGGGRVFCGCVCVGGFMGMECGGGEGGWEGFWWRAWGYVVPTHTGGGLTLIRGTFQLLLVLVPPRGDVFLSNHPKPPARFSILISTRSIGCLRPAAELFSRIITPSGRPARRAFFIPSGRYFLGVLICFPGRLRSMTIGNMVWLRKRLLMWLGMCCSSAVAYICREILYCGPCT